MKRGQMCDKNGNIKDPYWFCIKLSMIAIWLPVMIIMTSQIHGCPYPRGICKLVDISFLFTDIGRFFLFLAMVAATILYLFEKRMVWSTLSLFILSCIIVSAHESNGIFFRAAPLSAVWAAQFAAYVLSYFKPDSYLRTNRIHFGVQIIAASYTLAAIAKLKGSGLSWVDQGELFSLQVMKNYSYLYFDSGSLVWMEKGHALSHTFMENRTMIKLLLSGALGIELFCFVAVLDRRICFIYGILLLAMHFGIDYTMGIGVGIISKPMVVLFLNPLYLLPAAIKKIRKKLTNEPEGSANHHSLGSQ